jgi:hypothetical protein
MMEILWVALDGRVKPGHGVDQANPTLDVIPAQAGIRPSIEVIARQQTWTDPGLRRDDGRCDVRPALSHVMAALRGGHPGQHDEILWVDLDGRVKPGHGVN